MGYDHGHDLTMTLDCLSFLSERLEVPAKDGEVVDLVWKLGRGGYQRLGIEPVIVQKNGSKIRRNGCRKVVSQTSRRIQRFCQVA